MEIASQQTVQQETGAAIRPVYAAIVWLSCAVVAESLLRVFITNPSLPGSIGRVVIAFIILHVTHRFASLSLNQYRPGFKDLVAMASIMLGSFFLIFFGRIIANSLASYLQEIKLPGLVAGIGLELDPLTLYYAIPYAAGGILVQSILGLQCGLVFAIELGLIVSLYSPAPLMIAPFVISTTLIGCFSMVTFRSRSAYIKAGGNVAVFAIPFVLSTVLITGDISISNITALVGSAIIGGILCSFVCGGVIPVLESFGGYTTDISLLEMATLDHPLLKELSISAPGTWNHSMVMGMMSEQAAESVGANPVIVRVGAYFHDIGKSKNPLYFVENQGRGENRHDKLSSSMSALIIRSHVKDGIKMAREHKLPKIIEDMIPQHHGTSRIEFFYKKACEEAKEAGEEQEVDTSLYMYPGPKPQTKEAGILMLADGIEAATRTLSDPSHDRIQGLVQKMINKVFSTGQLAECELTLKDLHAIARCFTRVLTGIHHQRVSYPEPAEKVREKVEDGEGSDRVEPEKTTQAKKKGKKQTNGARSDSSGEGVEGGSSDSKENGSSEEERSEKSDKENLKRLGI